MRSLALGEPMGSAMVNIVSGGLYFTSFSVYPSSLIRPFQSPYGTLPLRLGFWINLEYTKCDSSLLLMCTINLEGGRHIWWWSLTITSTNLDDHMMRWQNEGNVCLVCVLRLWFFMLILEADFKNLNFHIGFGGGRHVESIYLWRHLVM